MRKPALWVEAPVSPRAIDLERSGWPALIARLLARRGVSTAAEAAEFLNPNVSQLRAPIEIAGMAEARDRLLLARDRAERVAIVGDYDADGVTATALLSEVLRSCGLEVLTILPDRFAEGYGFQPAHAETAAAAGCRIIVTVDCGVSSHDAVGRARGLGLDVVLTDHHLPAGAPPPGAIVVDPHLAGPDTRGRELTGVGLAFKLATALLASNGRTIPFEGLLRVACIGTIADVAPLRGENRVIAALGLAALATPRSPGLRELMRVAQVSPPLSSEDVAFRLAPRLNAAGRLGSAERALELLVTRDERRAADLAQELDRLNRERQRLEQKAVQEARARFEREGVDRPILVAWDREWHRGVVGIAAGRLARELRRPVLLLAQESDLATGSGRSVPEVDLYRFLEPWTERLVRFGGHTQAVGLTASAFDLEDLREEWTAAAASWPPTWLEATLEYDLAIEPQQLTPELVRAIAAFGPHGAGNPEPVLRLGPLQSSGPSRIFGNGHLEVTGVGPARGGGASVWWAGVGRTDESSSTGSSRLWCRFARRQQVALASAAESWTRARMGMRARSSPRHRISSMTSDSRARTPFRRLRLVLLWAIGGLVAALGGLYWLGRAGPLEPAPRRAPAELSGATAVSEGFDYTQVLDNRPVFRIRGQKFRSTQEGTVELTGVGVTLYRDGGEYGVESARALYDPGTKEATLDGEVRLTGGTGLSVKAPELRLVQGGRRLRSDKPIHFEFPGGQGSAGGLDADLDHSSLVLLGPVAAAGKAGDDTPIRLETDRATFLRQERQLRAEGNVTLTAGTSTIRAQNLSLDLAEDERTPQFVRANGDVQGELREGEADPATPPAFSLSAKALSLEFEPGRSTPAKLQVEGSLGATAVLVANAPGGLVRVLLSRLIVGTFTGGTLAMVETVGSSEVKEYQDGDESKLLRLASAKFAQADLAADRHLEALTLTGEVVLRDERLRAVADRAYLQPDAGTAQLFGEPVQVTTEKGKLNSPRVVYQREGERVHAEGGVEAEIDSAALPKGTEEGVGSDGRVRIQAREAFLELATNGFIFRGGVQAYQGTSVLFAEQLRAEDNQRRLAASGGVKTVWKSPQEDPKGESEPVEVVSSNLIYRESEGLLLYEGEVKVTQADRSLRADSVEVELDEHRRARQMRARGKVKLQDPSGGRNAEGDEALYDLLARTVTIDGAPAVLHDRAGNVLKGRKLVYDLEKGALKATGGAK